jgi:transcriptional regulator with XRE-family HTH domain
MKQYMSDEKFTQYKKAYTDYVVNYQKALGLACAKLRIHLGFSQTQVANDLEMDRATVCRFEQGKIRSSKVLDWYLMNGLDFSDVKYDIGNIHFTKED